MTDDRRQRRDHRRQRTDDGERMTENWVASLFLAHLLMGNGAKMHW